MQTEFSSAFLTDLKEKAHFPQRLYKNFWLKKQWRCSETELLQANQTYQRGSDFFSASYSGEWLFLALSQEKIGVDLEIIKPRSPELLEKYSPALQHHFQVSDRNYFYLLWTAKEAVLKASNRNNLDLIENISLSSAQVQKQRIGQFSFHWQIQLDFEGKSYIVWSGIQDQLCYSLASLAY
ncbi:MAG: 4'-phosphopantetheinyl transferase superfamily protein [bacterium]|nr:4'-phosphopantetheinyl transferase superfamily protein [bacterium]